MDHSKLLTLKTIQKQLIRLLNHFPGLGRTISTLEIIAPDYLIAFKGLYCSEFINLVNIAIQDLKFFPVIADLKKIEIENTDRQISYNPYGGIGSLPMVKDIPVLQEIDEMQKNPEKMTEKNKTELAELLKKLSRS